MAKKKVVTKKALKDAYTNFDQLVGKTAKLYLTAVNANQFQLGSVLFEVMEDENDGYRSMMDQVRIVDRNAKYNPQNLLGIVTIKSSDIGYRLLDQKDGHCWLEFGTDDRDSYYPCFVYNWQPKPSVGELINLLNL